MIPRYVRFGPAVILPPREWDIVGYTRYVGRHCVRQARRSLVAWRGSPAATGSCLRGGVFTHTPRCAKLISIRVSSDVRILDGGTLHPKEGRVIMSSAIGKLVSRNISRRNSCCCCCDSIGRGSSSEGRPPGHTGITATGPPTTPFPCVSHSPGSNRQACRINGPVSLRNCTNDLEGSHWQLTKELPTR